VGEGGQIELMEEKFKYKHKIDEKTTITRNKKAKIAKIEIVNSRHIERMRVIKIYEECRHTTIVIFSQVIQMALHLVIILKH